MNKKPNETTLTKDTKPKRKNKISKEKRKLLNQKYRTHIKNHVETLQHQYNSLYTRKYKDYPLYWYNPFLIPKIYSRNYIITIEKIFFKAHYDLSSKKAVYDLLRHSEECQHFFIKKNLQLSNNKESVLERSAITQEINRNKVHVIYCEQLIILYRAMLGYYNIKHMIDDCV